MNFLPRGKRRTLAFRIPQRVHSFRAVNCEKQTFHAVREVRSNKSLSNSHQSHVYFPTPFRHGALPFICRVSFQPFFSLNGDFVKFVDSKQIQSTYAGDMYGNNDHLRESERQIQWKNCNSSQRVSFFLHHLARVVFCRVCCQSMIKYTTLRMTSEKFVHAISTVSRD